MNTPSQNSPVRKYLLAKKLPWDIMLEVEDHISAQIQDLEISKNLTFDEAFLQAQLSWEEELKTDRPSLTTYNEFLATPFVRKIYWEKRKSAIFSSVGFALFVLILLILTATELDISSFRIVFIAMIILSTFIPVLYYIRYFGLQISLQTKFQYTNENLSYGILFLEALIFSGFHKNKSRIFTSY